MYFNNNIFKVLIHHQCLLLTLVADIREEKKDKTIDILADNILENHICSQWFVKCSLTLFY